MIQSTSLTELTSKEDLINGMMTINMLSMPFRAINTAIDTACNTSVIHRAACDYTAEKIQSIVGLVPESCKKPVKQVMERIRAHNQNFASTLESEFDIPMEETAYCLKSAGLILEGLASAATGSAVGKAAGIALKESIRFVSKAQENVKMIFKTPNVVHPVYKTILIENTSVKGRLELAILHKPEGSLTIFVDELRTTIPGYVRFGESTKTSGTTFLAMSKIKELARTYNTSEVTIQWSVANKRLFDVLLKRTTRSLEYLGKRPSLIYYNDSGSFPTFKLLNISPKKTTSHLPKTEAQKGALTKVVPPHNVQKITTLLGPPVLSLPSTVPTQEVTAFTPLWITPEEGAKKLIEVAGDITGVTPALVQVKELEKVFTSMLSDPKLAPKLLVKQLLTEPERIFQKIIAAPDQFLTNCSAFLSDPSLLGALNIVGIVFAVIAIANDVLPVLTRVSRKAFNNPANLPATISKELVSLTKNKIVALFKTTEGLLTDPLKTAEGMAKDLIKSPERLLNNIKDLTGLNRKKHKKAKRRAKELAAEQALIQITAQKNLQIEKEHAIQEIIDAFPACYSIARRQWMISETMLPKEYFSAIVEDWKNAIAEGRFSERCGQFILTIYSKLMNGHFSEVAFLSPSAHAPYPIPPRIFFATLAKYMQSNLILACEAKIFQRTVVQLTSTTEKLRSAIQATTNEANLLAAQVKAITLGPSLKQASVKLQGNIDTLSTQVTQLTQVGPAVAALLRNKITPEKAAKLMAALPSSQ